MRLRGQLSIKEKKPPPAPPKEGSLSVQNNQQLQAVFPFPLERG
jgi:hypothetical protein